MNKKENIKEHFTSKDNMISMGGTSCISCCCFLIGVIFGLFIYEQLSEK